MLPFYFSHKGIRTRKNNDAYCKNPFCHIQIVEVFILFSSITLNLHWQRNAYIHIFLYIYIYNSFIVDFYIDIELEGNIVKWDRKFCLQKKVGVGLFWKQKWGFWGWCVGNWVIWGWYVRDWGFWGWCVEECGVWRDFLGGGQYGNGKFNSQRGY